MLYRSIVVFVSLFLFVSKAMAGVESARVRVDGLTCPFCAYGIEKKFKQMKGVRDVVIKMKAGETLVKFRAGANPTPEEIRRTVIKAGFTPKEVTLTVTGRIGIRQDDSETYFVLSDTDSRFLLIPPGNLSKEETEQVELRWRKIAAAQGVVEVEGVVLSDKRHSNKLPPPLQVKTLKPF